jgi:hypothetical protein
MKRSIRKVNKIFLIYLNGIQMNEVKGNKVDKMDVKVFLEDFRDVFLMTSRIYPLKEKLIAG